MVGVKGAASGNKTVAGVILGSVAALILSIILTALAAFLISGEKITQEGMRPTAYGVLFISSALGCLLSGKIAGNKPAVVCTVTAAAYALMLIGCCVFFFDGAFTSLWIKLGLILAAGIVSCIVTARKGRGRKRRSR